MKAKRHAKILELIEEFDIDTQEELQDRLNQAGFTVTQATVSRDIKELRLIKTLSPNGNYHYTTHGEKGGRVDLSFKFHAIFAEAVNSIDYAQNLVVIKTITGMANAACEVFDAMVWNDVVGTLSGDDTFLVLMRSEDAARTLVGELAKYIAH